MKKNFTKQHEKLYNSLYNNLIENNVFTNLDINTFIIEKKRYLMSYIENNKLWSKKLYYFMIARYLLINKSEKYSKLYSQAGYNLKIEIEKHEGNNEIDENEQNNIKDYSYFINILESIDYKTISNIKQHYEYLLLAMLIYNPALRTSFYTSCKIIRKKILNYKINNYVLLTKRGKNSVKLIVNKDKASNYKFYNQNKEFSKIKIENEQLINQCIIL